MIFPGLLLRSRELAAVHLRDLVQGDRLSECPQPVRAGEKWLPAAFANGQNTGGCPPPSSPGKEGPPCRIREWSKHGNRFNALFCNSFPRKRLAATSRL